MSTLTQITEPYETHNKLHWKIVYNVDDQHMKKGRYRVYTVDNNVIITGSYKDNTKHGTTHGYNSSGCRLITETHENNVRTSYKVYSV